MFRKTAVFVVLLSLGVAGCALYSEVTVLPLTLHASNIDRGSDLASMLRKGDFLRAIDMAPTIDTRPRPNPSDLAALGNAYLAAGRFDDARTRLRAALDLKPFRATYAQIAWDLSQVEYLSNNFESSLEWATIAIENGLSIRQWHLDYLRSLVNVPVYNVSGSETARVPFRFGRPDVPRLGVRVNRSHEVEAILDSGAVLSIVSTRLASTLPVRSLGTFQGTFFGLLGEPIPVTFGMLDTLEIGDMLIENIPVAIMPDEKMRFLISRREGTEFLMDFLLGSHLLKEFRLELNFDRHALTLTKLRERDRRPHAEQNLFFQGFRPHVRGTVNRKGWHLFILDTGSEITFLNQARLSSMSIPTYGQAVHSATLQGLGGAMKRGSMLENVELGVDAWGGRFKTLPMYLSEDRESSVGIIGQNFLRNFNVTIDFGTMRVELKRR
jgi:hypothetical protein